MKQKKYLYALIMTAFTIVATTACNNSDTQQPIDSQAADTQGMVNIDNLDDEDLFVCDSADNDMVVNAEEQEPQPEAAPAAEKKNSAANSTKHRGKETLYISTYGANGKVWGHVTMNGNTGRGTIHDDDENTYAISVTRHGNELFGTDQNGRQYVFRL